ncbi:TIGR04211 family SH3 domain-containing protein [Methylomagnum sp.]
MPLRILFALILCFPLASLADAHRSYVTDKLEVQLRAGQSAQSKLVRVLDSGTPLTILTPGGASGYAKVKLDSGEEGWLLTKFISDQPGARSLLDEANHKLAVLQDELTLLKLGKEGVDKAAGLQQTEIERLKTELIAIRQASANVLQIQTERDRLQESVIKLERDVEATRRERDALDGDYRQNWFLLGAGVLFGGILLGVFLPRFSWRKKSAWDTF